VLLPTDVESAVGHGRRSTDRLPEGIGTGSQAMMAWVPQSTFFLSLYSKASPFSRTTPWPSGPRNCGQFKSAAVET
jgi:hypothetical protein